jgi:hypothetical protein
LAAGASLPVGATESVGEEDRGLVAWMASIGPREFTKLFRGLGRKRDLQRSHVGIVARAVGV